MKKLIASLCAAAAFAAIADTVTSDTVFGVLKVTSNKAQTAISVPWCEAGTNKAVVLVKDLVKTSNLNVDDQLLQYVAADGKYKGWKLNSSGTWEGYASVSVDGTKEAGTDTDAINCGDGLIIIRGETSLSATDHAIYLYGQYTNLEDIVYTMACDSSAVKYSLFAPINCTSDAVSLNDFTWANVVSGDRIRVQSAGGNVVNLRYDSSKGWGMYDPFADTPGFVTTPAKVQPGMGAWYMAAADSTRTAAPTATPKKN